MPLAAQPHDPTRIPTEASQTPLWLQVYRQLELNKLTGVTSYQVNNNLFIVVPLGDK